MVNQHEPSEQNAGFMGFDMISWDSMANADFHEKFMAISLGMWTSHSSLQGGAPCRMFTLCFYFLPRIHDYIISESL